MKQHGFTLLEVLVALTVASLALLAGMAALGSVSVRAEHAEQATVSVTSGAAQRELIVEWLRGAQFRSPTGEEFAGLEQDEEGNLEDLLLFPTTSQSPIEGSMTVVGLYIDKDPETPERGLVAELTGMKFGEEPRRMELVPEAGVLLVRYLNISADGFSEWVEQWQSRRQLPAMVEIILEPAEGDSLPRLLRYPIRVALAVPR
jgi:prepilin-type N-terminal cleavage/methylation domain-containing protein